MHCMGIWYSANVSLLGTGLHGMQKLARGHTAGSSSNLTKYPPSLKVTHSDKLTKHEKNNSTIVGKNSADDADSIPSFFLHSRTVHNSNWLVVKKKFLKLKFAQGFDQARFFLFSFLFWRISWDFFFLSFACLNLQGCPDETRLKFIIIWILCTSYFIGK